VHSNWSSLEVWLFYEGTNIVLMNKETKLRIHTITAKVALKFGREARILKKRKEQRLEAEQIKFLRHLLGITKLDKGKKMY
jgi:hypothetical protein